MIKKIFLIIFLSFNSFFFGQGINNFSINGNLVLNGQTFQEDLQIGAEKRDPNLTSNLNILIKYKNNITAGVRYDIYKNPIPGFEKYEGNGIGNRFIQFQNIKNIDITLGHFYDQFGSGILFRSYFDPNLGIDNSVNGLRIKYNPISGIDLMGIIGKQKNYWELGPGIIRGFDANIYINNFIFKNSTSIMTLGLSFVTKKQKDNNPVYILPENVGSWSGRATLSKGNWNFEGEYAYKINDPSQTNNYIYKNGNSLILSSSYSIKGLGFVLSGKRVDNMNYRSDRNAVLQELNINFLTSLNKQQSYALASIYPYVTQPNGEMGMQFDCFYKIPKKSKLGGKYGTEFSFNFSNCFDINKTPISPNENQINEPGTLGYESNFFKIGENKLFQELNIELKKKVNRKLKLSSTYINIYNNDKILKAQKILENSSHEEIYANIFIAEGEYRIKPKYTLKSELQHLHTNQHFGNWGMILIEANMDRFFFSIQDLYNYGHPEDAAHYYSLTLGMVKNSHRLELRYGKVRAGLFCVGGICREVPASNGFSINLTSTF